MTTFIDQINNSVQLPGPPKKIISLVPSQTELLYDLGLDEEVVGITKFCIHPKYWFNTKQRIGGTKTVNVELVKSMQPDLVIANKEENVKSQVEEIGIFCPVFTSDINTLEDALEMILQLGKVVDKEEPAIRLVDNIQAEFATLPQAPQKLRTAYLIWKDPYMTVGPNTFISDMLGLYGFENIIAQPRYPQVTIEELKSLQCELLLLSSEPYPFKEKHIEDLKKELPGTKVVLVDGEMFSWYGSRLQYAPTYFIELVERINQLV
jgi:ABC-type Fe3+-hydroxamate transport system substrate-binding protein